MWLPNMIYTVFIHLERGRVIFKRELATRPTNNIMFLQIHQYFTVPGLIKNL